MKLIELVRIDRTNDMKEDFNWAATIGVLVLILSFIGATFYVLVSSLKDLN